MSSQISNIPSLQAVCAILQKFPVQPDSEPSLEKTVWDKYNTGSVEEREAYLRFGFRQFRTEKFSNGGVSVNVPEKETPPDTFEHDLEILFGKEYVQRSRLLDENIDIHRFVIRQFFPVGMSKHELDVWGSWKERCGGREHMIPDGVLTVTYRFIIDFYEHVYCGVKPFDEKYSQATKTDTCMSIMRISFQTAINYILNWTEK